MTRSSRALLVFLMLGIANSAIGQRELVHPGLSHKQSDLDRMKYMVETEIDPWYSSFQDLKNESKASYNYSVQGDPSKTVIDRNEASYGQFGNDGLAAYLNALMWGITGDDRHAQKCVEIFNAWVNVTEFTGGGTESLNAGRVIWKMMEAAEIIRSTYDGWSAEDIQKFSDMLVYPGYSTTQVPPNLSNSVGTFYWRMYQGDPGRHGNQDVFGFRGILAMGVFLDNEIMFERGLRYFMGLPHREDDLPYEPGPGIPGSVKSENSYFIDYNASRSTEIEDYGYNGVLEYLIWENGQLQESSRDQDHGVLCLGMAASMAEMAWNQGEDVYGLHDDRVLSGYEYSLKYNVSYEYSYPDQMVPWEPTVANGLFIQRQDRTGRWFSKAINPYSEGNFDNVSRGNFLSDKRPIYELPIAHYIGRMGYSEDDLTWTRRAREVSINEKGYEKTGWSHDHLGWGALTARRAPDCPGDPVSYVDGNATFGMNVFPGAPLKAENFDHFVTLGEGHTYHDESVGNSGGEYRTDENVDIAKGDGNYYLTDLEAGEWYAYTVDILLERDYNLSVKYAAATAGGSIRIMLGETNLTGTIDLPATGGETTWQTLTLASDIALSKGVRSLKIYIEGSSNSFSLDEILLETSVNAPPSVTITSPHNNVGLANGSEILFEIEASDIDGDVVKVEFYLDNVKIGEDVTAPYSHVWNAESGQHTFSAKAIDSDGSDAQASVEVIAYMPDEDKVLHYDLDHNLLDISGNLNHATIGGDVLYTSGQLNSAMTFSGGDDHLSLPSGITSGITDFTISCWVNLGDVENFSPIFYFEGSNGAELSIIPNPVTNKIRFELSKGNTIFRLAASEPEDLPKNEWVHIAATLYGQKGAFYINGEIIDSDNLLTLTPNDLGTDVTGFIGKSTSSSDAHLTGQIDEFIFLKRGLSMQEVQAEFQSGLVDVGRPEIEFSSLSQGDEFDLNVPFELLTLASDANGSISKVVFYEGINEIGEALTDPYSLEMSNIPTGNYRYSAVAIDNEGYTKTTDVLEVSVVVPNVPPSITITNPSSTIEEEVGRLVTVAGQATDSDGNITLVEIFANDVLKTSGTDASFSFNLNLQPAGDYIIKVVATDDDGAISTSETVLVKMGSVVTLSTGLTRNINIFPNPVKNWIKIESAQDMIYRVFDPASKVIMKGSIDTGSKRLLMEGLPRGIYLLHLSNDKKMKVLRFFKE